jgi:D-sedoheptulose 7-phosphate isomerase
MWTDLVQAHLKVLSRCEGLVPSIVQTTRTLKKCLAAGGKVLVCGNGGSAAQAQHLAAELVVRFQRERPALAALVLGCNPAIVTATVNDLGPQQLFVREFEALYRPGDVLIGISTSGRSPNVIAALAGARRAGAPTVGLTGHEGMADPVLHEIRVPSTETARVQEVHQLIIHALCEGIDA